jgi:hypothetical protein
MWKYSCLTENNTIMTNSKAALNYNLTSENLYLKLFQIANQNLNLVQKEERASRLMKRNYLEKKEERHVKK